MNTSPWNIAFMQMAVITKQLIGKPIQNTTPRQEAALFFSLRVTRRNMAIKCLFMEGLYNESLPIIRRSYEDWILLSYILLVSDSSRWDKFKKDVDKFDATVYKGFLTLTNPNATDKIFGKLPDNISKLIDKRKPELKPWDGKTFRQMAQEVGLEKVHDLAYAYLSNMAHGSIKDNLELFHVVNSVKKAKLPTRDLAIESSRTAWIWWFHLRILTLAGHELGYNLEGHSDMLINEVSKMANLNTFEACIMQKENIRHITNSK